MNQGWLLLFPVLLPMLAGVIGFMLPKTRQVQAIFSIAVAVALVTSACLLFAAVRTGDILTVQLGSWAAPFGITFVADTLSAVMVVITAILALATTIYATADIDDARIRYGFYPFLQFLLSGICGAFLTGDIFNLYVWFEVMLISSFALLSLGGEQKQLYGTVKYVSLNLISTVLLLSAIGMLYGVTGSLNMADIAVKIQDVENTALLSMIAVLFIVAFGIKSAVFPLFFWLPASYHTPPFTVSAIFAGLLTKVGVYALFRVFTLIFTHDVAWTHGILLWIAGFTMLVGVLGAAVQFSVRRILSFHIISQIGYMIAGLGLFTTAGLIGGAFYIVHHIIVKANLFFVGGVMRYVNGSAILSKMGGLYVALPALALLFLVPALSLAGIPPLSGFWAKFAVIKAGILVENWWIVAIALITGLFTIFSMMKIWAEAFWKKHPEDKKLSFACGAGIHAKAVGAAAVPVPTRTEWVLLLAPCVGLATLTVIIGFFPQPFFEIAEQIAEQLLNPQLYIAAVLGE